MKLTKRDKELLRLLSVVLIAAAYLFLGILPLHRANGEMHNQLSSARADMEDKQKKLASLAEVTSANVELHRRLEEAQENFYPMMESREIDRILTRLALEKNLSIRKMEIQMPTAPAVLTAFGEASEKKVRSKNEEAVDSIYQAIVLLEVIGDPKEADSLLDVIALESDGIRVLTMRRIKGRNRAASDEAEKKEDMMELRLEISMCRKGD